MEKKQFPAALVQVLRETLDVETTMQNQSLVIRTPSFIGNNPLLISSLVHAYFTCHNCIQPLIHQQYYDANLRNSTGYQLTIAIACVMSVRNCGHTNLSNLSQTAHLELINYFTAIATEQVQEMMLLDNPPLTFPILLICLASAYVVVQKMKKARLLIFPARAYLQQHAGEYIRISPGIDIPSNPEIETYKYAVHCCKTLDDQLSCVVEGRRTPEVLNIEQKYLIPALLEGDDTLQHLVNVETLSWHTMVQKARRVAYLL